MRTLSLTILVAAVAALGSVSPALMLPTVAAHALSAEGGTAASAEGNPLPQAMPPHHSAFDDIYFGDRGTAALLKNRLGGAKGASVKGAFSASTANKKGPNPKQPASPVIALVASPISDCPNTTDRPDLAPPAGFVPTGCYTDFYVKWLQPFGVRVVPMNAFWPLERKKALLSRVNGVMLLGGGLDGDERVKYAEAVQPILDFALARPGFLLWGTCQGFQVMGILLQQDFSILTCDYVGTEPSMLPLEFTTYQPRSVLFGLEAQRLGVVSDLIEANTTLNWHHCGIDPAKFKPKLANAPIIANNVDTNGKPFVSAYEIVDGGRNVFAVQYHPERPALWYADDVIGHDRPSIDVANYHARFIADRLKLNTHSFADASEVDAMDLNRFPHRYAGWGSGWIWIDV